MNNSCQYFGHICIVTNNHITKATIFILIYQS